VGAALVATENHLYALERKILGCLRQKPEEWIWRRPCDSHEAVILAGETLFVGGDGTVTAVRTSDGQPLWQREVEGRAQGLVVANGALLVSTDRGVIHAFRPDSRASRPPSDRKQPPPSLTAPSLAASSTRELTMGEPAPPRPDARPSRDSPRTSPAVRRFHRGQKVLETTAPVPPRSLWP
jgi:hypothetical protein